MAPAPGLPPIAARFFKRFVDSANKGLPHVLDWGRFYQFIAVCHTKRVKLSFEEVEELVKDAGFRHDLPSDFASAYQHGRCVLKEAPKARLRMAKDCIQLKKPQS